MGVTGGELDMVAVDMVAVDLAYGPAGPGVLPGPVRVGPRLWAWAELLRGRTALVLAPAGLRSVTDPALSELAGVIEDLCARFAGGDPVYVAVEGDSTLHEVRGREVAADLALRSAVALQRDVLPVIDVPGWYQEDVAADIEQAHDERSR